MLPLVLTSSLLILASADSSIDDYSSNNSKMATALEGISDALHCIKDLFQESVQDNKNYDNLEKLVLELKGDVRSLRTDQCDIISQVNELAEEKGRLKFQLAAREEKVQELEQLLQSTRQQNEQHVSKIQELEKDLQSMRDENALLVMKVHALDTLLKNTSQREGTLVSPLSLLNNPAEELGNTSIKEEDTEGVNSFTVTVEKQENKLKNDCELAKQPDIAEQVEEFSWSRDVQALQQGLEAVLSNKSTPYKQLHHLGQDTKHSLWLVGYNGYTSLAMFLVCAGLPAKAVDADGDGMLHGAVKGGQFRTVAMLLDLGADVESRGSEGRTPIMFVSEGDQLAVLKLLLKRGAVLNATASDGETILHYATRAENVAVVMFLVSAGADTTVKGKDGYTALDIARIKNNVAIINFLSEYPS